jgi:hypothetical protein
MVLGQNVSVLVYGPPKNQPLAWRAKSSMKYMRRAKALFTTLCVVAALVYWAAVPDAHAQKMESVVSGPDRNAATEWKGSESELADPFVGVITEKKDWDSLWKRAFGKKAPSTDLKKHAVACVFLGHYPGWWYSIHIGPAHVEGRSMVVPFGLVALIMELRSSPGPGKQGSRGQYLMRVVEKKEGYDYRMEMVGRPQVPPTNGFPGPNG